MDPISSSTPFKVSEANELASQLMPPEPLVPLNLSVKIRKEWFDIFNRELPPQIHQEEIDDLRSTLQRKWEHTDYPMLLTNDPFYPVLDRIKKAYGPFNFDSILQNEEQLEHFLEATKNDLLVKFFSQLGNTIEFHNRDELMQQLDSLVSRTYKVTKIFPSQNGPLPIVLKFLPHLEKLYLVGCNLQTHPLSSIIDGIKKLKLLLIPFCRLESIPVEDLKNLPNLCLLDIRLNCLNADEFPAQIGELTRIDLVDPLPESMKIKDSDVRGIYINVERLLAYLNEPQHCPAGQSTCMLRNLLEPS